MSGSLKQRTEAKRQSTLGDGRIGHIWLNTYQIKKGLSKRSALKGLRYFIYFSAQSILRFSFLTAPNQNLNAQNLLSGVNRPDTPNKLSCDKYCINFIPVKEVTFTLNYSNGFVVKVNKILIQISFFRSLSSGRSSKQ
jgi:hypothetical protein